MDLHYGDCQIDVIYKWKSKHVNLCLSISITFVTTTKVFFSWMHYLYKAKHFQNRLVPSDCSVDKGLTPTRTSAQNLDNYNGYNFYASKDSLSIATFKEGKAAASHLRSSADVGD